jgi:hypothetical protein
MKLSMILIGLAAVAAAFPLEAASGTGHLDVSVQATGSITFTIQTVPGTATGLGTGTVSTAFGNVSHYGPAPTASGLSRNDNGIGFDLRGTVGFKVTKLNLNTSTLYLLTAQLTNAPAPSSTWSLNGLTIQQGTPSYMEGGPYGVVNDHLLVINFFDFMSPHAFNNTINFIATSN